MVPEAVGGACRRAARLTGHAKEAARKARGLEAALVHKTETAIAALDPDDQRTFTVAVAGPAALLVAKLHKVAERLSGREQRRLDDKDALDIVRLLRVVDTHKLTTAIEELEELMKSDVAREVTQEALRILRDHFTDASAAGAQTAARAVGTLMPPEEVAASCAALASDLMQAFDTVR